MKESKKNKSDESEAHKIYDVHQIIESFSIGVETPEQKLIIKESKKSEVDNGVLNQSSILDAPSFLKEYVEKEDLENVKKEMNKNYRDIKSEILKNEAVTAQKFNNLDDNFSRKLNKVQHDNDVEHEKFKKEFKRFKILSNLLIAAIIVGFAIFLYLFFSKPERPATVIWPEYDHTKPFNPFSDKNPNQSITVGDPAYDSGLIDNTNSPTPFPGWDQ